MKNRMNIAIGKDWAGWHEKFTRSLEKHKGQGLSISFDTVSLDCVDWQKEIADYDIILWNPNHMGIRLASHFKEKIFFIQYFMNKLVIPNFRTVWHFESKVAQSYLFDKYGIKTPRTFVCFDYTNARHELKSIDVPVVLKKSEGAASSKVKLIQSKKNLDQIIESTFARQLWQRSRPGTSRLQYVLGNITKRWFWYLIFSRYGLSQGGDGVVYWQNFIPNNQADLRITVIGNRFAYGFWRNNRPRDFRASGSGRIDYERHVPKDVVHYCMKINEELDFDSMCYDILFANDSFLVNEMSYNYIDKALFNAPGYFEKLTDDAICFRNGHLWPQELWVKWMLMKTGLVQ